MVEIPLATPAAPAAPFVAGQSRRSFLHHLAAIGGTGLVMAGLDAFGMSMASAQTAPPALAGSGAGKQVVILGAGVGGMTAAYELAKLGYQCQVIEARSFVGGRCQTARAGFSLTELGGDAQTCEFDDGQYINHGPWRIPYNHQSTLHYTKEFGVPLEVMVNDNDASYIFFEGGSGPLAGRPVRKAQVAADMRGQTAELLAKAVRKGTLDDPMGAEDKELFVAYLVREGYLSPKDLGYSGADGRGYDIWPGALTDPGPGKPGTPFAMADILHSRAWRTLRSVAGFTQQRTMFQPVGGMDRIAQGFAHAVGHMIQYSTMVERIGQDDGGVEVAWVDGAGQRGTTRADYCVCTIPLSVLQHIEAAVPVTVKQAMAAVGLPACRQDRPANEAALLGGGPFHLWRPRLHRQRGDRQHLAALVELAGRQGHRARLLPVRRGGHPDQRHDPGGARRVRHRVRPEGVPAVPGQRGKVVLGRLAPGAAQHGRLG